MRQTCKFQKGADRGVAMQGLAVDRNKMINDFKVPDSADKVIYNQLDDIKAVGCRVSDTFDAIMQQRALASAGLGKAGKAASQDVTPGVSAPSGGEDS